MKSWIKDFVSSISELAWTTLICIIVFAVLLVVTGEYFYFVVFGLFVIALAIAPIRYTIKLIRRKVK